MAPVKLIEFQDAVGASVLNPDALYAIYYADGSWPNETAVRAQCPHAKLFGVTVRGLTGPSIFACDCETGDLTPAEAVAWVSRQVDLGVKTICVYANLDTWLNQGLKAALDHYGARIKRWVADFNGVDAIQPWADAEQYSSTDIDLDVARATFFGDPVPPPKPVDPHHYLWFKEYRLQVEDYDRLRKHPIKNRKQLKYVRYTLRQGAERIAHIVISEGRKSGKRDWAKDRRGWRYQQLIKRANGKRVVK